MFSTLRTLRGSAFTIQPSSLALRRLVLRPDVSRTTRFCYSSSVAGSISLDASRAKPSLFRRAATVLGFGVVFTFIGFAMAASPAMPVVSDILNPPTDEESLSLYVPKTEQEREVYDVINNHPLAKEFREKEGFSEVRPYMKIPEGYRSHSLTAGTLSGPGRIVVPPLVFAEDGGKSMIAILYLGHELCGHPGIIHGGLLATILDEGLARCCFAALPHNMGVTANLNINYRAPTKADSYVVLRATTTKVEGRKAWVDGRIETLPIREGDTPVVLAEATALFISPKQAAYMPNIFKNA